VTASSGFVGRAPSRMMVGASVDGRLSADARIIALVSYAPLGIGGAVRRAG
jgi:hypothetical protein